MRRPPSLWLAVWQRPHRWCIVQEHRHQEAPVVIWLLNWEAQDGRSLSFCEKHQDRHFWQRSRSWRATLFHQLAPSPLLQPFSLTRAVPGQGRYCWGLAAHLSELWRWTHRPLILQGQHHSLRKILEYWGPDSTATILCPLMRWWGFWKELWSNAHGGCKRKVIDGPWNK